MGYWVFMLMSDLLVPLVMIGFGALFMFRPPRTINSLYVYRTRLSMKNEDTWAFAHRYAGRVWLIGGLILLPISVLAMLPVIGRDEQTVGTWGGIVCILELIPLAASLIPTELALRRTFDDQGNRRAKR